MASLENLKIARQQMTSMRYFHYSIAVLVCAAWAFILLKTKSYDLILHGLLLLTTALNIFSIYKYTVSIREMDDFLVYITLKCLKKEQERFSKTLKFPKSMQIKKADVIKIRDNMENSKAWVFDESKSDYYLIYDKKLGDKHYGENSKVQA